MEDVLLDCLIAEDSSENIESQEDSRLFTESKLRVWVQVTDSMIASGVIPRLALKLLLWAKGSRVGEETQLGKLIRSFKKKANFNTPIVNLMQFDANEPELSLIIPVLDNKDEGSIKNLSLLIRFCAVLHGVRAESISILEEEKMGKELNIPKTVMKLVEGLTASALDPLGNYPGEDIKFGTGFHGTLPCLLATMRLLTNKQEFLRKRKLGEGKSATTFFELQQSFNVHAGWKTDENNGYGVRFVKSCIQSCLKANNRRFPGSWIHSTRKINGVKSDFALINKLGWTEFCPSHHKALEVLFNTVDEDKEVVGEVTKVTGRQLINITQDKRNFIHQEFRTALALCLPRIDTSSKVSLDDQLKIDPLSVKSLDTIKNFKEPSRMDLVDRLNESYALRVSLKNPKSKTREVHYKISRDRLLASSANIALIDGKGVKFDKLDNVPKHVIAYMRRKFHYPEKRTLGEGADVLTSVHMIVDGAAGDAEPSSSPRKRRKMTKGEASAAVRRSGRLAQKKAKQ